MVDRLERLERAVDQLLAAARRGEVTPTEDELWALEVVCLEQGAIDAWMAIRRYITDRTRGEGHTSRRRRTTTSAKVPRAT